MRILVIQHEPLSPIGLVGQEIKALGGTLETVLPCAGDPLPPDATRHDGLIMTGGGMSANDDALYPHYSALFELIRGFARMDKPILGICLGSQMLARALGAKVAAMGFTEYGFNPVELTGAGAVDPLLGGLGADVHFMQYHEDRFEVPEGAVLLARNGICDHQAFRHGTRQYGFQFHLEVTDELARSWAFLPGTPAAYPAGDPIARVEADLARHYQSARAGTAEITRRWMSLVEASIDEQEGAIA